MLIFLKSPPLLGHAIEETINIGIKRKCEVILKIWEDGRTNVRGGMIENVDLYRRTLQLDDPFGLHTFQLDDIIDVTATE
ncbi:YolD-like family protein [Psychrobacillus lasiicapitis]|uniref:YolD-like family protein n=1 Tax=Psychrobacillus lasiicapitis TaxID=1636719 RepID=A0A544T1T2_9BACI|nr:YolD-like family protein [Psychrobacillus lasiicapitis]GGA40744.1 hypothetical protein GCM10011384_33000 [Psychrobacillus lasiicapitis]